MKIAITGGAGFIASNIADAYIKLGHDVSIIDNLSTGFMRNVNSAAHFYNIDITTPELTKLFEQEHFDFVSHHAAQMNVRFSVANPLADASTNILGSINICEACVRTGVKKIVFASSGGTVYGEQSEFPAPEEHRLIRARHTEFPKFQLKNIYSTIKTYLDWIIAFSVMETSSVRGKIHMQKQA